MSFDEFPKLYGKASSGKLKSWEIKVINEKIVKIRSIYGFVDGKQQITDKEITKGKNIGKANETTPYTQAISEAKSKWTKKYEEGYRENKNLLQKNVYGTKDTKPKTILPMLALDYHKRGKDIVFPCFVQPKLDGVRCIAQGNVLCSRTTKVFEGLSKIKSETEKCPFILDGELYSDTLDFQALTGLIQRKKNIDTDLEKQINLVVYDIISDEDYSVRLEKLKEFFSKNKFKNVKLHLTEECKSKADLKKFHDKYVKQGYEGLMIRNKNGGYKEKYRSKNLQKYKMFEDAEFEIVGFTEGTGIEKGLIIWICKIKNGDTFQVRPKGTHSQRKDLFKKGNQFIGEKLTVKYQELTNDGIPRFPTTPHGGLGDIRDYE